jgi:hypothetical protein
MSLAAARVLAAAGVALAATPAAARDLPRSSVYFRLSPGMLAFAGDTQPVTGVSVRRFGTVVILPGRFDPNRPDLAIHHPEPGFALGLTLGATFAGMVSVEGNALAQGFHLSGTPVGGSGFAGASLKLHPVGILAFAMPDRIPLDAVPWRRWDVAIPIGGGWAITGQDDDLPGRQGLGQEGYYVNTGAEAEWWATEHFALGLDFRILFANFGGKVFFEFDERSGARVLQLPGDRTPVVFATLLTATFHVPVTQAPPPRDG